MIFLGDSPPRMPFWKFASNIIAASRKIHQYGGNIKIYFE
jgi:hypothetical protein